MAHLQYIPGDPRLVDQLVYELKSKGIFDQFRKDCIADVDTRPAYQNLRQRVENSVSTFLARQCWKPDLNKNQLREKLRKHILDGNYLEQGVERIVDQVVNPKVASVFIPQVEDLVYNYLGITRKKTTPVPVPETSNTKVGENNLLPTDLEAVSPGSVDDDKIELMDICVPGEDTKMEIDQEEKLKQEIKEENDNEIVNKIKVDAKDTYLTGVNEPNSNESSGSMDKSNIPLPDEEIKLENIPAPKSSPPKTPKVKTELEKIKLPEEPNYSRDIPLPDDTPKSDKEHYFKPVNSDDDGSSSDSSLIRNMSPLTPIRNFNNENSCDAQQAFENDSGDSKNEKKEAIEPNTFRFTIESKNENNTEAIKPEKKDADQTNLSYQFSNQVNINAFNTPLYDDSSNSNLLQIDYESDANSKINIENKISEADQNSNESKKDKKQEDKKSSHRNSHSKDSHRHSSSKDRRSDSKQSSSRDSRSDRKSSKDDHKSSSKSSRKERSRDRSDKKESRDSSKQRSSHKSSGSSNKDSKSHRSSSSSQRHSSSSKQSDEKRSSSSSHRDKEKSSKDDKYSKEKSLKDSKSSSSTHKSDKNRKSSSSSKSKHDDKEKKKNKKETDDHYSASGRGSHNRRSTDRDSNDGSSSSKGSHNPPSAKSVDSKKESKGSTSKSDNTSTSGDSTSPSDKDNLGNQMKNTETAKMPQNKPIIRVENHLERPIASPPRLPFVPDVTLKKPRIAANLEEARKLMKMRKFLDEEQKRMNQEAALLLEFQANVRPSMSQVYSSIPGPELEFACITSTPAEIAAESTSDSETKDAIDVDNIEGRNDSISDILNAAQQVECIEVTKEDVQITKTETKSETVHTKTEIEDEVNTISDRATVHIENLIETDVKLVHGTSMEDKINEVNNTKLTDEKAKVDSEAKLNENVRPKENLDSKIVIKAEGIVFNKESDAESVSNKTAATDDIEDRLQDLLQENKRTEYFEITVIAEELSETEDIKPEMSNRVLDMNEICPEENVLEYFGEHEKYKAELERDQFSKFLKAFTANCTDKMYLINCSAYEENVMKEISQNFGTFEVVNYYKNGYLKLNNTAKNIVRNVNVSSEISLPVDNSVTDDDVRTTPVFSPVKSECSFELSSDYDAKLEEMVSKTSRREIMEIILGSAAEESTVEAEMPTIDYCVESNIESDYENTMKRKYCEVESSENNNRQVLTPNKIRKMSDSDQITSTTEEAEETSNNNVSMNISTMKSKYLGRARRVGLPRPKRPNLPNSPSSDKSIENYEQNTPAEQTPNGKIKTQRTKVQRYDTSDLYKPKLHYLSRRNNIS